MPVAIERLVLLGREAKVRMACIEPWRMAAAREAVGLMPEPVAGHGDGILQLQHALRAALMAGGEAGPGVREFLGRACYYLSGALSIALHGRGIDLGLAAPSPRPSAPNLGEREEVRRYWLEEP